MNDMKLGAVEAQFADIIWGSEPLSSGELVALCAGRLGWKKSTTYTVLKRLCGRGLFKNENGMVSSLVSRGEYDARRSEQFLEDNFGGSLPAFLAAFSSRNKLTESEISELKGIIEKMGR